MVGWLYRWLPRVFGCHCREDRSFHYRGRPFPICARCTGELVGMIAGVSGIWLDIPVKLLLILLIPMIADGVVQMATRYESTNVRRFLTGVLFGFSIMNLFIISNRYVYQYGREMGRIIMGK